jgi:hypothetical protein
MPKETRRLSLDADVEAILEDISTGQGSASAYVSDLVRDAEREWRTANKHLRAAGWGELELCAAFDALNGWMLDQPPRWAAAELADAAKLNGLCEKWDVTPDRWTELCGRIEASADEARALVVLAREFWRFNPRVERLVNVSDKPPAI